MIYPSQGLVLYQVPVSDVVTVAMKAYNDWLADFWSVTDVVSASMQAYNDWLAEFCRAEPTRLKGIAMVNVDDIDDAVAELLRCREPGLAGALITVAPPAVAAVPVARVRPLLGHRTGSRHAALVARRHRPCRQPRVGAAAFRLDVKHVPPSVFINKDYQVRQALADLILSGVFERFPRCASGRSSTSSRGSRSSSTR